MQSRALEKLSVITPIFNEEDSIPRLVEQLMDVLGGLGLPFEIICVDDGSTDKSAQILRAQAARHPELKVVELRRNYGQTAAIMAGIDFATGDIIISIDADLQNDPKDIPRLLEKIDEGYDVVSGWRCNRLDAKLKRVFTSRLANRVISTLSGVRLHDYGCTLKAYRRDIIKNVRLYGEMHRFIPIYASWHGARVIELPVDHHARAFGSSKYGLDRTFKVVLDLFVVMFLQRYLVKPIYLFGGFGLFSIGVGALALSAMIYMRLVHSIPMISTPLPLLSAMTILVGVMSLLMGLLAEMLTRTYYESQGLSAYSVRETINIDGPG
jgi:dolichol-phosphate mannosyltransferase